MWEDAEHIKHSRFEVIAEEQQDISRSPYINKETVYDVRMRLQ